MVAPLLCPHKAGVICAAPGFWSGGYLVVAEPLPEAGA
jgi:hypothetical protein